MIYTVFVPAPDSHAATVILPGSAIVGEYMDVEGLSHWAVAYEGNKYGAENLRRYIERVLVAGARHRDQAPSRARVVLPAKDLFVVGQWDPEAQQLELENDVTKLYLAQWLGLDQIPNEELVL